MNHNKRIYFKLFNKILLSGVILLFLLCSFLSLRFSRSLRTQKVQAQGDGGPRCYFIEGMDEGDLPPSGAGVVNRKVSIEGSIDKNPTDVIIQRYFYSGVGSWTPVGPSESGTYFDNVRVSYTYLEAKDYTIGVTWVYKNASNETKTITCSTCLRIFDTRETGRNFGTKRLIYPTKTSDTQVITGSKRYVGYVRGGSWSGNNMGIAPALFTDGWRWQEESGWNGLGGSGYTGEWGTQYFLSMYTYPKSLPTQFTFTLTAPITVGNGAYSDYNFDNLLIYSRDLQKNPDGTCGGLPPISSPTPTPTSTPTPTLTPPPISNKCTTVSGYVRNSARVEKPGISGAKVRVWAMKDPSCTGSYSWCGTGDLTTNAQGYFSTSCSAPMSCLRVIEVQNAPGYKDSTVWPTVPAGSTVWSVNQVVWKNPPAGNCGTFTFYDIPSQ